MKEMINKETMDKEKEIPQKFLEIKEKGPEEMAEATCFFIKEKSKEIINEALKKIDAIHKASGLPPSKIEEIEKRTGIFSNFKKISGEIVTLSQNYKKEISSLSQPERKPSSFLPGEVFDPEKEIERLTKLPREERKREIEKFEEKLIYQKEGLAEMQETLVQKIRENPDVSLEQLEKVVEEFAINYGFSEKQKKLTKAILEEYQEKHRKIRELREKYPFDEELFFILFGIHPQGRIEVIEGPMTLYFRCHDPEDFKRIYCRSFPFEDEMKLKELSKMVRGALIRGVPIKELEGTILIENSEGGPLQTTTLIHEEQHAIYRLFEKQFQEFLSPKTFNFEFISKLKESKSKEEREELLISYLRVYRDEFLNLAKDEVLAYLKSSKYTPEEIFEILTLPKEEGGLYDYFSLEKKLSLIKNLKPYLGEKEWLKLEEVSSQALFKVDEEYHNLLKKGIEAFEKLKENGYSLEQAIALLITEPFSKWEKVVSRILEQKKKVSKE